jgi:hypothetical protein
MRDPLVEDWIRYCVERRKSTDPLFAAWDKVHEIVHDDPETGWTITLALIEAAPHDRVLANVAAGPLEDLLCRSPDPSSNGLRFNIGECQVSSLHNWRLGWAPQPNPFIFIPPTGDSLRLPNDLSFSGEQPRERSDRGDRMQRLVRPLPAQMSASM